MSVEPTRELIDAIFWDKVRAARAMSGEAKFLAGPQLFDRSCRIMADGVRYQFPEASEEEVKRIVRERLDIVRRLESRT